jgi:hypothetical protein
MTAGRWFGDTLGVAKVIFSAITSLDGYIEDEAGRFDWAEPDDEVSRAEIQRGANLPVNFRPRDGIR